MMETSTEQPQATTIEQRLGELETALERASKDNQRIHRELAQLRAESAELDLEAKSLRAESSRLREVFAVRVGNPVRARMTPPLHPMVELTAGTSETPHRCSNPLSYPSGERSGR